MDFNGQKIININIIETILETPAGDDYQAANATCSMAVCSMIDSNLDAGLGRVDTTSVSLTDHEMTVILDTISAAIERGENAQEGLIEKAVAAGLVDALPTPEG